MTHNKKVPRLLIVSINALRKSGSNGKVMRDLLLSWPTEKLAQLYLHNETPDFDVCHNYYRVTDKEALIAFCTGKQVGGEIVRNKEEMVEGLPVTVSRPKKNPLTLLLRDLVWNSRRWQSRVFWQWIEAFSPEVVLVQAGESSFSHQIGIDISEKYRVPLVVFNTENYFLKDYNYFKGKGWSVLYPLLKWESGKVFEKMMQVSVKEIYNNELLDEQYYEKFGRHGEVIYQSSTLSRMIHNPHNPPVFSYAGNLGINRHKALIELADALQEIASDYYLDVYGRAPSEEVVAQFAQTRGIRFHGLIPYENVLKIMENSDFMIHAESFDPFWVKDLNAAFSTKISDILKAGKCLILYADNHLACSEYIIKNQCGYVISDSAHIAEKINELLSNQTLQSFYRDNAAKVAERDMSGDKNAMRFQQIISSVCN